MDYAAEGQLRKVSAEKAWATIEELARYEDERWNDPVVPEKESLKYENLDLEQLLGIMECRVGTLMEEAIALMGRSESIFGMSSNIVLSLEPSRQEAFEDLVMNFILGQEERVKQLEEYTGVIGNDFMQLSPEVIKRLKEEIRLEKNRIKKIKKITRIAKSFGLLINLMVDALSVEPRAQVFRKKSLIVMRIMMDLRGGTCWPAKCQVREYDVVEEAANEEACGSAEMYENMIRDDCHLH
ncbi:hypothetical protein Tco_1085224 [Tanacetum coccineum]